jgi:hypothetical protein
MPSKKRAVKSKRRLKAWTLLAYTVADDKGRAAPLDQALQQELKALCRAADLAKMNVALQVDMKRQRGVFRVAVRTQSLDLAGDGGFVFARPQDYNLWRNVLDGLDESADLELMRDAKDLNSASGGVLRNFLSYGRKKFPAKRYAIFFYGHSAGPMGLFYDQASGEKMPRILGFDKMNAALRAGHKPADVILFRDCFVDTLEIAYQLRGVARFVLATQAEAPVAGTWPWFDIMPTFMKSAQSVDVATAIETQLAAYFRQNENRGKKPGRRISDVPYAVLDIDATKEIIRPLTALATALDASRKDPVRCRAYAEALEEARVGSLGTLRRPGDAALLDIPTMCDNLQKTGDPIATLARNLRDSVKDRIVKTHHSQKGRYRGISIYYKPVTKRDRGRSFLQMIDDKYYKSLALSRATGWHRIALKPLRT